MDRVTFPVTSAGREQARSTVPSTPTQTETLGRVPREEEWRRIVDLARLAPSVHNTQPWSWQVSGDALELHADRRRALPRNDPDGRNLVISCGTALHHALMAAEALGWHWEVALLPDSTDPDFLARVRLQHGTPPHDSDARTQALRDRRTDRRRFTSWPVPEERLAHLAETATQWGTHVLSVDDPTLRMPIEGLVEVARMAQLQDPGLADEVREWVGHAEAEDGIPSAVLPELHGGRGERANRFGTGPLPNDPEAVLQDTDGLLVVCTETDDPRAWLQAGSGLSDLWLTATAQGLSVVPLTQVIEVRRTREALREYLPHVAGEPQILARVGWQAIGRPPLPPTPRRGLDQVLRSAT